MAVPIEVLNRFAESQDNILDTRWIFHAFGESPLGILGCSRHYIQVVDIRNERALCVTVHADNFQRWSIPISNLLATFSAFTYLGTAEEMSWVRRGSFITFGSGTPLSPFVTWEITGFRGEASIEIARYNEDLERQASSVRLERVISQSRQAQWNERTEQRDREARRGSGSDLVQGTQSPAESSPQETIPPTPPSCSESASPAPSSWQRLTVIDEAICQETDKSTCKTGTAA